MVTIGILAVWAALIAPWLYIAVVIERRDSR